jgi:uncharacterized membrane protein YkvA (DUF1232 family)
MWPHWSSIALGMIGGLLLLWLALVGVLWVAKPDDLGLREAARLLPDLLRMLKRLAKDPTMPKGVRVRLVLLLGYLAMPFDLIPDFIPILGYADDAIITALVVRSIARRAGPVALSTHWSGTPEGLAAVRRLCGLPASE